MDVTIKIESSVKGHETLTIPIAQAMDRIGQETEHNGKWLYCDGNYINVDTATQEGRSRLQETLASAKEITLAGTLLGG